MFVNQGGSRFFNEGTWVQPKSLQIMQNTDDGIAYTLFDSNWQRDLLDSLPHGGGMFWDSFRYLGTSSYEDTISYYENSLQECLEMGTAFQADSIEELAEQIGAPADVLKASVERYNELCAAGEDTDFNKDAQFLYQVAEPPFYSTKVGACLLTSVGGVKVDRNLQCLDGENQPIEGPFSYTHLDVYKRQGQADEGRFPTGILDRHGARHRRYGRACSARFHEYRCRNVREFPRREPVGCDRLLGGLYRSRSDIAVQGQEKRRRAHVEGALEGRDRPP